MTDHTTSESTNEIPYGYCHCGCGQKTSIAKKTSKRWGHIKGHPVKYLRGHARPDTPELAGPNPSGFCFCGCGQKTKLAKHTDAKHGVVKGQPNRYIIGHSARIPDPAPETGPNPSGLCLCGCGQKTTIAQWTHRREGHVKGQPISYVSGHHKRKPPEVRFWNKVQKPSGNNCWNWAGSKDGKGYGTLNIEGRLTKAHRFSYELHVGPIPDGLLVCHTCDNPSCVNPAHLWLGTNTDNMQDMADKGRARSGGAHGNQLPHSKLCNNSVVKIRRLYQGGELTQKALAEQFGVSASVISNVVRRKTWKHIP